MSHAALESLGSFPDAFQHVERVPPLLRNHGLQEFQTSPCDGGFPQNQGIEFTALVLFLLVALLIWGLGRFSLDYHLKNARRIHFIL